SPGRMPLRSSSPTRSLSRRRKLPPIPGMPPARPTTGLALGSAQYIADAAIGTLCGVHPQTRLLPPRQRPGAPLSGFSARNRTSDTPGSSLSRPFPLLDPTCHHELPLSTPSRNGNAPSAPPSNACPALAGVDSRRPSSSSPNATSPSGSGSPPPAAPPYP